MSSSSSSSSLRPTTAVFESLPSTPVHRHLGTSTDDAAIFLEDTVDRVTAQCIDASPSALALLSPQRMPTGSAAHVDITEYDVNYLGSLLGSHRRGIAGGGSGSGSSSKGRAGCNHRALHDVTNTSATQLNFCGGSTSKSPTPKATRGSMSHHPVPHGASHNTSFARSGSQRSLHGRSPSASEPMVPLAEYEALQRERNRYEKMYEHQRALYEEMAHKHSEAYQALQGKIIEVVALSTRNEESKRFIRQLKREMSESRTRVMDMQNRVLEETKLERSAKVRYETLIQEHERKYERLVERHETKLVAMESLVKDLTCLRGERDRIHVSQLDSLLRAAYSKSTALFSDLLRQGKQIDLLYDAKDALATQLDQQRKEKREMEAVLREERRHMAMETERMIEQIEEQQQSILNLRQMLIRTMDNRDDTFAYRRNSCRSRGEYDENDIDDGSSDSSDASSPRASPIPERDMIEEEEGEDVTNDGVYAMPVQEDTGRQDTDVERSPVCIRTAAKAARPIICVSRATVDALSSNSVGAPRPSVTGGGHSSTAVTKSKATVDTPPLPLASSDDLLLPRQETHQKPHSRGRNTLNNPGTAACHNSDAHEGSTEKGTDDGHCLHRRGGIEESGAVDGELLTTTTTTTGSSPGAAGVASGAVSKRQMDFSMALAAVTEKRRRDRVICEESDSRHASDKENSKPPVQQGTIVRSCTVGSIPTARKAASTRQRRASGASQPVEDEEAEPRLFPRNALRALE
ncbi:hypothetical protein JKF63_07299 [Porcisia hertigi]|uniref:Uncharacterized protein n=1 Tax=Porcisia hertigi TaxID=2761500 RepID=A0A836LLJ4_9TRYP|nr:hypothetical protein JKF63_07299 [Porcisia hertigi]